MKLAKTYPIRRVCALLGVPRSSVYYHARPPVDEAAFKTALLDLAGQWPTSGRPAEAPLCPAPSRRTSVEPQLVVRWHIYCNPLAHHKSEQACTSARSVGPIFPKRRSRYGRTAGLALVQQMSVSAFTSAVVLT